MEIKKKKIRFDRYETRRFTVPADAKETVGDDVQLLCCTADVTTGRCEMLNNEVLIEGTVTFCAALRNGQGEYRTVSRTERFGVNETLKGAKPNSEMLAHGSAENVKCRVEAGSLFFSCDILIEGTVISPLETEILVDAEGNDARTKKSDFCSETTVFKTPLRFSVQDSSELSVRMPEAERILCARGTVRISDARSLDGQLMLAGQINLSTVYTSGDEYEPLTQVSDRLEFSQIVEVQDAVSGYAPNVFLACEEINVNILPNAEGEKRMLDYNVVLSGYACATESVNFSGINDLYSTDCRVTTDSVQVEISCDPKPITASSSERIAVRLPGQKPPMARICTVQTSVAFPSCKCMRNRAEAEGSADVAVIYIASGTGEITGFNTTVPLRVCFDGMDFEEGTSVYPEIVLSEMQAALISGNEIEVRASFDGRFTTRSVAQATLLTDAEAGEKLEEPEFGIIVYIVQKNDTLWDICKHFNVDPEEISKLNPDAGETLLPDSRLYIFRRLKA